MSKPAFGVCKLFFVCPLYVESGPTLCDPVDYSLYSPWDSPVLNTGVACHFLLQGIFLTQGLNPGLLHCGQILYCLSHQGSSLWDATPILLQGLETCPQDGSLWICLYDEKELSLRLGIFLWAEDNAVTSFKCNHNLICSSEVSPRSP